MSTERYGEDSERTALEGCRTALREIADFTKGRDRYAMMDLAKKALRQFGGESLPDITKKGQSS